MMHKEKTIVVKNIEATGSEIGVKDWSAVELLVGKDAENVNAPSFWYIDLVDQSVESGEEAKVINLLETFDCSLHKAMLAYYEEKLQHVQLAQTN